MTLDEIIERRAQINVEIKELANSMNIDEIKDTVCQVINNNGSRMEPWKLDRAVVNVIGALPDNFNNIKRELIKENRIIFMEWFVTTDVAGTKEKQRYMRELSEKWDALYDEIYGVD